jgi:hypothetical protein
LENFFVLFLRIRPNNKDIPDVKAVAKTKTVFPVEASPNT